MGLAHKLRLVDGYGLTVGGFLTSVALGLVALIAALVVGLTLSMRAYGRTTCSNWGTQSGIATKYVILNWLDSGTCLAQTPDGRWVTNSHWQAFVGASK